MENLNNEQISASEETVPATGESQGESTSEQTFEDDGAPDLDKISEDEQSTSGLDS